MGYQVPFPVLQITSKRKVIRSAPSEATPVNIASTQ